MTTKGPMDTYKLGEDEKTPIPCEMGERTDWNDPRRQLALTEFEGVRVYTVFLCFDHSWGDEPPLLWESMVFGGEHDEEQVRYHTFNAAWEGHIKLVQKVKPELGREEIEALMHVWRASRGT